MPFGVFEYTNNKTNLRNYLTFTIRHIVYRNRNNEFSANANIPQILKNKITKYIKNYLELKFNIAKEKNKTALFEEYLCLLKIHCFYFYKICVLL